MIRTPADEPVAAPWTPRRLEEVYGRLRAQAPDRLGRPFLLAVDGRQGGGKTTTARLLAELQPGSVIVHTDDVAWWDSFFGWDEALAAGILEPLRHGQAVDFRPRGWEAHGREGSIMVPAGAPLVLVEGVGSSRRALSRYYDAAVWVQSDFDDAARRGIARDGGGTAESEFWWEWSREEQPFLAQDRPWERADVIICGAPYLAGIDFDPDAEVLVGELPAPRPASSPGSRERTR